MDNHILEKEDRGWTCLVCQWKWKNKPETLCPGVVRYEWWHDVPEYLRTKAQLDGLNLKPANEKEPDGCIYSEANGYCWLYDLRTATYKTKPTPAQKVAFTKALALLNESITLAAQGRGLLEPYRDGLIEVHIRSDAPSRYRWALIAVHLPNGEVYQPSDSRFVSHIAAIKEGKKVIDEWYIPQINLQNLDRIASKILIE